MTQATDTGLRDARVKPLVWSEPKQHGPESITGDRGGIRIEAHTPFFSTSYSVQSFDGNKTFHALGCVPAGTPNQSFATIEEAKAEAQRWYEAIVLSALAPSEALEQAREALAPAARDVLAERERQKTVEGWTPEHDDRHDDGALALAAGCYALVGSGQISRAEEPPPYWPFNDSWWKSTDARRDLVKAGALILAEIERLDRAVLSSLQPSPEKEGK